MIRNKHIHRLRESRTEFTIPDQLRTIRSCLLPSAFCLLLLGCLAPDSGKRAETEQAVQTNAAILETRAPKQNDPAILTNRTFGEAPTLAEKVKPTNGRGEVSPRFR